MIVKIFKAVWFLSVLVLLALLLYVYASLPEEVQVTGQGSAVLVSREVLFYVMLGGMALFSGLVFAIRKLYKDEDFLTWFHGLMISLNIFLVVAMNLVMLANSGEKFDFDRIGYFVYGGFGLFIAWAAAWPVYVIFRKKSDQ